MSDGKPGMKDSWPHTSPGMGWHRDTAFDQGRLPGQLPIPFPKIHTPITGPIQTSIPGTGVPPKELPNR
jgi:hypothetical protein